MKIVLKLILIATMFAGVFTACDTPAQDPPPIKPILALTADRYSLDADGVDNIVFTVKLDGEDVTEDSQVCIVDGNCLLTNDFSTTEAGTYRFYASYYFDGDIDNVIKSEEITVVANDVSDPEAFDPGKAVKKNVVFFVWTSTYCVPCYDYKVYMKKIRETYSEGTIVEANFYTDPADVRPTVIGSPEYLRNTINQTMADGRFRLAYQPEILVEFREDLTGTSLPTETTVRAAVNKYVVVSPRTAIKVDALQSDDKVEATVTIGAREADEYTIGIFLTEDHISGPQVGHGAGYDHINVVREMGTEDITGDSIGTIAAGQTIDKTFSFDLSEVQYGYNPDNLFLVVYVTYKEDGYTVIDNTRKIPANGLSGYEYAERN